MIFPLNRAFPNLISLICLAAGAASLATPAEAGPVRESQTAEQLLDSFESGEDLFRRRQLGAINPALTRRTGYARDGAASLLVEIPATGEDGRNSLLLEWSVPENADWSNWDGLSFWYQSQDKDSPGLTAIVTEAGGARYWRTAAPLPRKAGEWQLVELPFEKWSWSWEGPADANKSLDRAGIKGLRIEIRGQKDRPVVFALDGLGLYHAVAPYEGPVVSIDWTKGGWRRAPGADYDLPVRVSRLASGQHAEVTVTGIDYWGQTLLEKTLRFEGTADRKPPPVTVKLAGRGPGYVDLSATLAVDGNPVYREKRAVGWLRPLAAEDSGPNPDSIFGIWVGGGASQIGAKWSRMYLRGSDVELRDGQYVVSGGKPGVYAPAPEKDVSRTFFFSAMPKWLSSRPERSDWQKWSPTNWDEYGKFVEFAARGAYDAGVRYFEVWNEPVPYAYWMGSIESVVKLHEVTYQAIKRAAPDAVVLGPCPYSFVWSFLEEFFDLGGGRWIDDVVIHAYGGDPDESFVANLRKLRALMKKHGLGDRDIYITEKGYSTPRFTEREQAQNMVKTYVYGLSERIRLLTWHMLWDYSGKGDPGYAILRHDQTPRPAYCAYAAMTSVLERAEYARPVPGLAPTQRGFEFTKRGATVRVLWETGQQTTRATLRSDAGSAIRIDLLGGERVLQPSSEGSFTVSLDRNPVYLLTRESK